MLDVGAALLWIRRDEVPVSAERRDAEAALLEKLSPGLGAAGVVEALVQERAHQLHGLETEAIELVGKPLPLALAELGRERAEARPASRPVELRRTPSA